MSTLEGIGVKPIEAVGQEFDPNFHNAVMHVEDEELGENVVAEEFPENGYMYRDSVVRHSMVKGSKLRYTVYRIYDTLYINNKAKYNFYYINR